MTISSCAEQACPLLYDPICASNGVEYSNECQLENAVRCNKTPIKKLHNGKCTDRDRICTLPKIEENCSTPNYTRRYFYNAFKGKCIPFISQGCAFSKNSFTSEAECMGYCNTAVCSLPMEVGVCTVYDPRYFFNSTSGKCESFDYGGCRGNANNFLSLRVCTTSCDRCTLLPDEGNGFANLRRYHFDPETKTCKPFTYNGMNGNANRFLTENECKQECVNKSHREETQEESDNDDDDDDFWDDEEFESDRSVKDDVDDYSHNYEQDDFIQLL